MSDFWGRIKETELPVVLYGTGDAADRLVSLMEQRGVRINGVFASDSFVRRRTFHSFKVLSYTDARRIFGRMCIVMGFGTHEKDVIEDIKKIALENEFYCPSLLLDEHGNPFGEEYYFAHRKDFDEFRDLLTDTRSREILDAIIRYRLSGDITNLYDIWEDEKTSWGELDIRERETFIDIGAYNGDTIMRFLDLTGSAYERIIGFEPDRRSFRKAEKNLEGMERITLYNTLLSDSEEKVMFSLGDGRGNTRSENGREVSTTSLDIILEGVKPTIIKFDAEGDEEKILLGGRRIIGEYKPKLILSVYHRIDDFWRLTGILKEINPGYSRFLLRCARAIPDWDIILLCE